MAALPAISLFTGVSVTEGGFKTALTDLRSYLATLYGTDGAAATALATVGSFAARYESKTLPTTLVAADRGKVLRVWTLGTLSLTSAVTLGVGWSCAVYNDASGNFTIDPSGAETINGVATLVLAPGESCLLISDGSGWRAIFRGVTQLSGLTDAAISSPSAGQALTWNGADWVNTTLKGWELISTITPSSIANIDITLPTGYSAYKLVGELLKPASNSQVLNLQLGYGTFLAAYQYSELLAAYTGGATIPITANAISNGTNQHLNFSAEIAGANVLGSAIVNIASSGFSYAPFASTLTGLTVDSLFRTFDTLRLFWTVGNFSPVGSLRLYGLKK